MSMDGRSWWLKNNYDVFYIGNGYFAKLPKEQKEKLKEIGFVVNVLDEQWNKMYRLAKIYYEKHGNLLIPSNFKTINGSGFDEKGMGKPYKSAEHSCFRENKVFP